MRTLLPFLLIFELMATEKNQLVRAECTAYSGDVAGGRICMSLPLDLACFFWQGVSVGLHYAG